MAPLFAQGVGAGSLPFLRPHTQLELLVQIYVGFYVIGIVLMIASVAVYALVDRLRRAPRERLNKEEESRMWRDDPDHTVDDWWNGLEDDRWDTTR
jgi:hypothetical protein